MTSGFVIKKNAYYDSVFLMRIAKTLEDEPGVLQSAAVMATDSNKKLLMEIGIQGRAIEAATSNDLVVALVAKDNAIIERLLADLDACLQGITTYSKTSRVRSIEEAVRFDAEANIVIISVPGEFAGREAYKALELNKHVFLFSNNVPLEQEIELKKAAQSRGLLVMGPDCGTSIINGIGIGFANIVRRGPIGVIGASGTGIQEFTSLVHQAGSGISHAIGTGSRDLADAVGGITTLMALDALEADPMTKLIAIVSKTVQPETHKKLENRIRNCRKPVIGCFLGLDLPIIDVGDQFKQVASIDEAVLAGLEEVGIETTLSNLPESELERLILEETSRWNSNQKFLRGLFAGGSFCYQSQKILNHSDISVYSNNPTDKRYLLANPQISRKHTCIDLGDDFFTRGKPHPMIDARERRQRLFKEAEDEEVAVVLLDFILGFISSHDPAGDLSDAICEAKAKVTRRGDHLTIIASVCGTSLDPQGLLEQQRLLRKVGAIVFSSNAQAASFCARLINERVGRVYGA